jgi:hypothetical protein
MQLPATKRCCFRFSLLQLSAVLVEANWRTKGRGESGSSSRRKNKKKKEERELFNDSFERARRECGSTLPLRWNFQTPCSSSSQYSPRRSTHYCDYACSSRSRSWVRCS